MNASRSRSLIDATTVAMIRSAFNNSATPYLDPLKRWTTICGPGSSFETRHSPTVNFLDQVRRRLPSTHFERTHAQRSRSDPRQSSSIETLQHREPGDGPPPPCRGLIGARPWPCDHRCVTPSTYSDETLVHEGKPCRPNDSVAEGHTTYRSMSRTLASRTRQRHVVAADDYSMR